ncbi:hypothetical protein NSA19_07175 [Actinomyces bowdenii]|uniref:hypothetical protein n=1 Tax=Actinomyces bowdenii TaxID=131109 RepID=UPI00214ACF9F|nr:hypothetical protein [Actinomyces bowdenii]MCR2052631.1 hypothetical protein [Actinomyces bowdenii]
MVDVTTLTVEDIERRRAIIRQTVDSEEFKERQAEGALLAREERLLDELADLDYLQYGRVRSH